MDSSFSLIFYEREIGTILDQLVTVVRNDHGML